MSLAEDAFLRLPVSGCGVCVATRKNSSAAFFTSAVARFVAGGSKNSRVHDIELDLVRTSQTIRPQETMSRKSDGFIF